MILVIPTDDKCGFDANVARHFGRCKTYTFINDKGKIVEIIENKSQHGDGIGLPPYLMKKHQAQILLCQELGPRAFKLCQQLSVEVYVSQAKTVKEIFNLWNNRKIKKAKLSNICKEYKL